MKDMTHQFLDWLRSKPVDEEYEFIDIYNCAVCHFLRESGYADRPHVNPAQWRDEADGEWHDLPRAINAAANGQTDEVLAPSRTFGAAVGRLEKLLNAEKEPTESVA